MGKTERTLKVTAPDFKVRNLSIRTHLLSCSAWLPRRGLNICLDSEDPLQNGLRYVCISPVLSSTYQAKLLSRP